MLSLLKNIFRKRCLKREKSSSRTGIVPPESIDSAVALLDGDSDGLQECTEAVSDFFKEYGIRGRIILLDLKSSRKDGEAFDGTTVTSDDVNWYGRPSAAVTGQTEPDGRGLFLSLTDSRSFTAEYLAKCSGAIFKIGRRQLSGDTFDLVIKENGETRASQAEIFREILSMLKKIKACR